MKKLILLLALAFVMCGCVPINEDGKALEAYPQKYDNLLDSNVDRRIGYRQGYDQAMQDFLEKACEWWSTMPDDTYGFNPCKIYVEQ